MVEEAVSSEIRRRPPITSVRTKHNLSSQKWTYVSILDNVIPEVKVAESFTKLPVCFSQKNTWVAWQDYLLYPPRFRIYRASYKPVSVFRHQSAANIGPWTWLHTVISDYHCKRTRLLLVRSDLAFWPYRDNLERVIADHKNAALALIRDQTFWQLAQHFMLLFKNSFAAQN